MTDAPPEKRGRTSPESDAKRPRLVRLGESQTLLLADRAVTIGRDPACSLMVTGKLISHEHAVLKPLLLPGEASPTWLLEDTSRNGIFMGSGVRMIASRSRTLTDGEVFSLGAPRSHSGALASRQRRRRTRRIFTPSRYAMTAVLLFILDSLSLNRRF